MDIENLLSPLAGDHPSGVELRNDARFHAIERLLEPAGRRIRLKDDGTINESAPPVDWSGILSQAETLATEGRDLRLLVIVLRGLYASDGFGGLSQGLTLLRRSVAEYWDSLHPALRERDDPSAAAMARSNALRQLDNDDNGLLGDIRFGIAFSPRGIGPVSLDDVARITLSDFDVLSKTASGLSKDEKDAIVSRHRDRANRAKAASRAMAAEQGEEVATMVADIETCLEGINQLCATFTEKGGFEGAAGLSLPELTEFLTYCNRSLKRAIADSDKQPSATVPEGDSFPASATPSDMQAASNTNSAANSSDSGTINSRSDVEAALDRIVDFYERTEPSSPIPHVARRLRRMVAMDFLQLMHEIAPSGLKEFRNIAGIDENKK